MTKVLKSLLVQLYFLPCSFALAQTPPKDLDAPELNKPPMVDTAELPDVHLVPLKHADAKELAETLEKIFDASVNARQLAIVGDSRANRLVIRSSDEIFVRVLRLVEELDIEAPARRQEPVALPATRSQASDVLPESNRNHESYWRVVQDINTTTNDPDKAQSLRGLLSDAVQRDFAAQQKELRTELAKLRIKIDSLESLLEKREAQKNAIILKRIETLLAGGGSLPKVANQNPVIRDPLVLPDPNALAGKPKRDAPLHTNVNLDPDSISAEITTILQAELTGEDGIELVMLDGTLTSLTSSLPFQLSNHADRFAYNLISSDGKQAAGQVKLECEHASEDFWQRLSHERVRLNVTKDELDRVSGTQMITKCIYLSKEPGKGLTSLVWDQVDAGVDIREKSKELGDLVVTMTLTRPATTIQWQHSYGGSANVQAYFSALAEYCRLRQSVGPHDPRTEEALSTLVANEANDQEIRAAAKLRQEELNKHIAAQKALSPNGASPGNDVPFLSRALSILIESGRREMERQISSEPDVTSRGSSDNFDLPKVDDLKKAP